MAVFPWLSGHLPDARTLSQRQYMEIKGKDENSHALIGTCLYVDARCSQTKIAIGAFGLYFDQRSYIEPRGEPDRYYHGRPRSETLSLAVQARFRGLIYTRQL